MTTGRINQVDALLHRTPPPRQNTWRASMCISCMHHKVVGTSATAHSSHVSISTLFMQRVDSMRCYPPHSSRNRTCSIQPTSLHRYPEHTHMCSNNSISQRVYISRKATKLVSCPNVIRNTVCAGCHKAMQIVKRELPQAEREIG